MKLSLLTMAFALLAFIPGVYAMDGTTMNEKAPVKAVIFYSDTCGSCKILEPHMLEAMKAVNMDQIDLIKFDFSSKDTIATTRALAKEKQVDATLQKYGAKTGFVILLNQDGEEIDKLGVNDTASDIASKFATAIVNAS